MTVAFMKPAHDKYCTRHWKSTLGKSLRVMRDRWFSSPYGVQDSNRDYDKVSQKRCWEKTAVVSKKRDISRQGSADSTEPECQRTIQAA